MSLKYLTTCAETAVKSSMQKYRDYLLDRYDLTCRRFINHFSTHEFEGDSQNFGYKRGPYVHVDLQQDIVSFYTDKTHSSPIPGAGGKLKELEKTGDLAMIVDMMESRLAVLYGNGFKEAEAALKALKNVRV